jgi:two-component system sensor histidine kinase HydH
MDDDPREGDSSHAAEPQGGREREFLDELLSAIRGRVVAVARRALAHQGDALAHTLAALQEISAADLSGALDAYRTDVLAGVRVAERAAALHNLAVGIGHDLRNPLSVIESSVFLLRQHLKGQIDGDPKIERHLSRISTEIERAEKLLGDLVALTQDRPLRRRETTIADLLGTAVSMAHLPTAVEVAVSVPAELVAPVDADQLLRAVVGLLVNASHAMAGSGRIQLDAERVGPELYIAVRDTGPGVPADIRARIFEPLFTTKEKSSGLGLSLARRVAEAHGGTIALQPSDAGALFMIRIPTKG